MEARDKQGPLVSCVVFWMARVRDAEAKQSANYHLCHRVRVEEETALYEKFEPTPRGGGHDAPQVGKPRPPSWKVTKTRARSRTVVSRLAQNGCVIGALNPSVVVVVVGVLCERGSQPAEKNAELCHYISSARRQQRHSLRKRSDVIENERERQADASNHNNNNNTNNCDDSDWRVAALRVQSTAECLLNGHGMHCSREHQLIPSAGCVILA